MIMTVLQIDNDMQGGRHNADALLMRCRYAGVVGVAVLV